MPRGRYGIGWDCTSGDLTTGPGATYRQNGRILVTMPYSSASRRRFRNSHA